jgi:polyhydroxyalkanoate depolymerase
MMYFAYQAHSDLTAPVRAAASLAYAGFGRFPARSFFGRNLSAACDLVARAKLTHRRLPFGLAGIVAGEREVAVEEEVADETPFGTLLHFKKALPAAQPRVLLVAPLSGHFATLLRDTVRTLLPDHDVFITDWYNARDVRLAHGRFGFDEHIDHIIRFLEAVGPGAHVIAVCQPCVQVLAAVAIMAEAGNAAVPRSMTLMAGPIDTDASPTEVNALAKSRPIEWFERKLIARVPLCFPGALRRVYPGFVQLAAFMSMNVDRHLKAHFELFNNLVRRDYRTARKAKAFYEEYFAVLDLPAEFYLDTVRIVFQENRLARGTLAWRGRKVELRAIRRTALLTIEGELDDICAVGQTLAAQALCVSLRPYMKRHYMQAGVGHYGVFSGKRWSNQIYPIVKNHILATD